MYKINGSGATADGHFTEGDPVGGIQATVVTDKFLNDVQDEILNVITDASVSPPITPAPNTPNQLILAIKRIVGKLATESVAGVLKIATQPQANSGVDDTTAITPKKLSGAISALVIQSTEVVTGIAKIATQAQADAGLDDSTIVTPKKMRFGFVMSFTSASGYVLFPTWLGGLLIQYGRLTLAFDAGTTFTWPLAWPDACRVLTGGVYSELARAEDGVAAQFRLLTKTNVVVDRQDIQTSTTGTETYL